MRPRIRSGAAALGTVVLASVLLSATPAAAISGGTVVPAGAPTEAATVAVGKVNVGTGAGWCPR